MARVAGFSKSVKATKGTKAARKLPPPEPKGQASKAYRHFRDAGLSPKQAYERATGKSYADVFKPPRSRRK